MVGRVGCSTSVLREIWNWMLIWNFTNGCEDTEFPLGRYCVLPVEPQVLEKSLLEFFRQKLCRWTRSTYLLYKLGSWPPQGKVTCLGSHSWQVTESELEQNLLTQVISMVVMLSLGPLWKTWPRTMLMLRINLYWWLKKMVLVVIIMLFRSGTLKRPGKWILTHPFWLPRLFPSDSQFIIVFLYHRSLPSVVPLTSSCQSADPVRSLERNWSLLSSSVEASSRISFIFFSLKSRCPDGTVTAAKAYPTACAWTHSTGTDSAQAHCWAAHVLDLFRNTAKLPAEGEMQTGLPVKMGVFHFEVLSWFQFPFSFSPPEARKADEAMPHWKARMPPDQAP